MSPYFALLRRMLFFLFDIAIIAALFEQVIWEGESNWAPVVCIPLFILFFAVFRQRWKSLSIFFVLGISSAFCWWILVTFDELKYCTLGTLRCPLSGVVVALALLSLAALLRSCLLDLRTRFLDRGVCVVALVLALLGVLGILSDGLGNYGIITKISSHEVGIATCFAIIAIRAVFSERLEFKRTIYQFGAIGFVCFLLIATLIGSTIMRDSVSLPPRTAPYALSETFLVPLLVAEDPIFFHHYGLDFKRLRDSLRETLEMGQIKRGGSTISMQVAKVRFLSQEKTFSRKLTQILLALVIEQRYSKEEILRDYMEVVPFGVDVIGLKAASLRFFHKMPESLSSDEALQLVLSIYDPSNFSPETPVMPRPVRYRSITIRARERVYEDELRRDLRAIESPLMRDK